jgi:chromosome partitioning protein
MLNGEKDNMPKIVSFLNYKGGVGKTNVSVNFACHAAKKHNLKTLIIDWDPQGDSTEYVGFGRENVEYTIFDFLAEDLEPTIGENIVKSGIDNLYLIGANPDLKNVEHLVSRDDDTFDKFRALVHECGELFDLVVIDCPPANSHVNIASIFASTNIFVVTTASSDSIDKIGLVDKMVNDIRGVVSENVSDEDVEKYPLPELAGVILTMAVENTIGLDVAREHLKEVWGDLFIEPAIPRTVAASYSVSENIPVIISKPQAKISIRYSELFEEVLARV